LQYAVGERAVKMAIVCRYDGAVPYSNPSWPVYLTRSREHCIVAGTALGSQPRGVQVAAWRVLHTRGPLMGW